MVSCVHDCDFCKPVLAQVIGHIFVNVLRSCMLSYSSPLSTVRIESRVLSLSPRQDYSRPRREERPLQLHVSFVQILSIRPFIEENILHDRMLVSFILLFQRGSNILPGASAVLPFLKHGSRILYPRGRHQEDKAQGRSLRQTEKGDPAAHCSG